MTATTAQTDRRRTQRLWFHRFRGASEFGVLYSCASEKVYEDLVDGPMTLERARELVRGCTRRGGVQAIVVARVAGTWRDGLGNTADEVLRHHTETGKRLGTGLPPHPGHPDDVTQVV